MASWTSITSISRNMSALSLIMVCIFLGLVCLMAFSWADSAASHDRVASCLLDFSEASKSIEAVFSETYGHHKASPQLGRRDFDRKDRKRLVHVTYEAAGVAAFGGLGAAVGKMLAGHGAGAIAVLPYFGFLRPQGKGGHAAARAGGDAPQHLFSYDAACGLPGLPKTPSGGAPGAAGAFNAVPGRSLYHFWGVRGPGASWAVLVQPPSAVDYLASVPSPKLLYQGASPSALGVFAQGAAVALAALCPPGGGLGGPCEGAVFHGGNTARALLAVRQLAADGAGQALAVSPELRSLYFIHDGLSEIKVFAAAEDLAGRLGALAASGNALTTPRGASVASRERRSALLLPGLGALQHAAALTGDTSRLGLTALAALHADAVATVSPSLARVLLPGGEVMAPGHTARALRAVHEAGRLWAVPPVAPAPAASLGLPSAGDVRADAASAARQLWAAKERARVRLLGEGYRGVLGAEEGVDGSRRFVVLFVGRLEANKGAALLVPLGRRVCGEGGHLVVLSTGATDDAGRRAWSALHSWKAERPECVSVVGGRDPQLGPLARAGADICVVPSWLEGYGLVAAEALQHGCYLVASDTTGVGDIAQASRASGLSDRWVVPEGLLARHPELQMFPKVDQLEPAIELGDRGSAGLARAFAIAGGRGTRLPAEMQAAMAARSTAAAAARAVLRAAADLRALGGERASLLAVRALGRVPTARGSADRIVAALRGRYATQEAPGRRGPQELERQLEVAVQGAGVPWASIPLGFGGRQVPLTWRLGRARSQCGAVAVSTAAVSPRGPRAAFVGREVVAAGGDGGVQAVQGGDGWLLVDLVDDWVDSRPQLPGDSSLDPPPESSGATLGSGTAGEATSGSGGVPGRAGRRGEDGMGWVERAVSAEGDADWKWLRSGEGPGAVQLVCLGESSAWVEARVSAELLSEGEGAWARVRVWVALRGGSVWREARGAVGRAAGRVVRLVVRLDVGVAGDRALVGVEVTAGSGGASVAFRDAEVVRRQVPTAMESGELAGS